MQKFNLFVLIISIAFMSIGCPMTKEIRKETPPPSPTGGKKPPPPEMTVSFASLNLAKLSKRIERKEIEQVVEVLKKEKIDVLTIQGISRYPEVTTRMDIVDELSRTAGMRNLFGETITLSGKQNGNAIFSFYPILSSQNSHYDDLHSTGFEAALQAVIDCGTWEIVFVSTNLPEKASLEDETTCINRLSSYSTVYINHPLIIAGNMPRNDAMRQVVSFAGTHQAREEDAPRVWFSNDGSLKLLHDKVEHTPLGSMTIAEFGLFRK